MNSGDINYGILTDDSIKLHESAINAFECGRRGLNKALRNALSMSVTTLVFYNSDQTAVVGFCSYCCSSMKESGILSPAIEIKSFAVASEHQGDKLSDMPISVAEYIMRYCIDRFRKISKDIIRANYILLYAHNEARVLSFYRKCGFLKFTASHNAMFDKGDNDGNCKFYYNLQL